MLRIPRRAERGRFCVHKKHLQLLVALRRLGLLRCDLSRGGCRLLDDCRRRAGGGTRVKRVGGVRLNELNERLERTVTLVVDELAGTGLLELDRRETRDLERRRRGQVVLGSLHLGDCDAVLDSRELLTKRVPGWLEALAVTAPCCVELDEDILRVVEDDLVELRADEGVDGLILGSRNRLTLELGLHRAIGKGVGERGDAFGGDLVRVEGVLQVVANVLDDERGPLALEVKGLAVVGELDGVDVDEVHLALVLEGSRLEGSDELGVLGVSRVDEKVRERETSVGVRAVVLRADLIDERHGVALDVGLEILGSEGGLVEIKARLVELAVDDNSRGLDTSLLDHSGVGRQTKEVVVAVLLGDLGENGNGLIGGRRSVCNNNNLVGTLEFRMVGCGHVCDGGQRLPNRNKGGVGGKDSQLGVKGDTKLT